MIDSIILVLFLKSNLEDREKNIVTSRLDKLVLKILTLKILISNITILDAIILFSKLN